MRAIELNRVRLGKVEAIVDEIRYLAAMQENGCTIESIKARAKGFISALESFADNKLDRVSLDIKRSVRSTVLLLLSKRGDKIPLMIKFDELVGDGLIEV